MHRIIYCSQSTIDFTGDELIELLAAARLRNEAVGLSGMLLYSSQSFLQALEGDREALDATYARIAADNRHTNLRLIADVPITTQLFSGWSMGFEHMDDEELADDLPGFTAALVYPLVNPDLVTNASVAETLLSLYARNRVS